MPEVDNMPIPHETIITHLDDATRSLQRALRSARSSLPPEWQRHLPRFSGNQLPELVRTLLGTTDSVLALANMWEDFARRQE